MRSGPEIPQDEIDRWLPREAQTPRRVGFLRQCLKNMHDRVREEDYFNARVFIEAARWLEQNQDADRFFLTVESFDPHEPWFVPQHYRRMYAEADRPQQVLSLYSAPSEELSPEMLAATRCNYSALCTMCDRWFGHLFETMRTLGRLQDSLLIVTSDHGHSIGDEDYMGKRGYPAEPAVFDVPLFIRHPDGGGAGQRSELLVQHTDITAEILSAAGVEPPAPIDGVPLSTRILDNRGPGREHVTVAWGGAVTVVTPDWWLNCKVDGRGAFLFRMENGKPKATNVADENQAVVHELYGKAVADAGGDFPDYVKELASGEKDAPGCSALAGRPG